MLANEASGTEKQISLNASKIQELVSGTFTNNGFIIIADTELNDRFNYKSSDASTASQRPKLVIQYTTSTPTPGPSPTPTNTPAGPTQTPTWTPTPSQTPTVAPTTPSPTFQNATFVYDGDGKRVKSVFNGIVTTYFVGAHYEVTGSTVTKYYYAGAQRIAMRSNGTLSYLLGDHLGSTSLTTDAAGNKVSEIRYKPWGGVRYATEGVQTRYQYTGQFSYEPEFGLYFYGARWYDPVLSRFAQADTIIPKGVQGYDRYAYSNNNPVRYTDPSGHCSVSVNQVFIFGVGWVTQLLNTLCPNDNDNRFPDIGEDVLTIDELEYTGPDMPVHDLPEWGNDVIDLGGHSETENKDLPTNDNPLALMSTSADDGVENSEDEDEFLENIGTLPPEIAHEIQSIVDDVDEDLYVVGGYARGDSHPRKDIDYGAYAGSAYEKYLELFAYGNLPEAQHPPFPFSDSFPPGNNNGSPYIQFRPHQNPIRVSGR